jgi:hypothetical protein
MKFLVDAAWWPVLTHVANYSYVSGHVVRSGVNVCMRAILT